MNYTTKTGYRIALKQNTQPMTLNTKLEMKGTTTKPMQSFSTKFGILIYPAKFKQCNG